MEQDNRMEPENTMKQEKKLSTAEGKRKRKKDIFLYILIAAAVFAVLGVMAYSTWKKDMQEYPVEKLSAFWTDCFGEEANIRLNETEYISMIFSGQYIPFLVTVTLQDGQNITFSALWERNYNVDDGISTDYGRELVEHYCEKYGVKYENEQYWTELHVTQANVDDGAFHQLMTDLYNSNYVQSGQEVELWIYPEGSLASETVTLGGEEEFNLEDIENSLKEKLENNQYAE
ncbi:MAG: hypothetical protein ACI4A3_03060 [Lachnospiraceae bacterium]